MSKELIEQARLLGRLSNLATNELCQRLADQIEELEGANILNSNALRLQKKKCDALLADIARLRELLADCQDMFDPDAGSSHVHHKLTVLDIRNALAATPAQSLARLRNQVREECAVELDGYWDMAAGIIRAMKE